MKTQNKQITINLIVNRKGGVGKSFLTFLYANIEKENNGTLFCDLDASNRTSFNQLKFLKKDQIFVFNLLNQKKIIEKERIIKVFDNFINNNKNYKKLYIDFGATESEILLTCFDENNLDYFHYLNEKANINILIPISNTSYKECFDYYEKIKPIFKNIYIYINGFDMDPKSNEIIKDYFNSFKAKNITFGNFPNGDTITDIYNIKKNGLSGDNLNNYSKFVFDREIEIIKDFL